MSCLRATFHDFSQPKIQPGGLLAQDPGQWLGQRGEAVHVWYGGYNDAPGTQLTRQQRKQPRLPFHENPLGNSPRDVVDAQSGHRHVELPVQSLQAFDRVQRRVPGCRL